jgi:general secretion pathway protein G
MTRDSTDGRANGFTLVESVAAIVMIAIVTAIVGYIVTPCTDDSSVGAAKAQIKNFERALNAHQSKLERLPVRLEALLGKHGDVKFLNAKTLPKDPWNNDYQYVRKGSDQYTIVCYGADKAPGGDGCAADISSDDIGRD